MEMTPKAKKLFIIAAPLAILAVLSITGILDLSSLF